MAPFRKFSRQKAGLEENKFRIRGDGLPLKQQYFKIGIQKNVYAAQWHVHGKFDAPGHSLNEKRRFLMSGAGCLPHDSLGRSYPRLLLLLFITSKITYIYRWGRFTKRNQSSMFFHQSPFSATGDRGCCPWAIPKAQGR
ncbi:MAG: hypothetical protein WBV79_13250 [Rhodomicrobium sp.]